MASPNNPKSSAELIREYSQARVIVANKPKIIGFQTHADGTPIVTANGQLVPKAEKILTDHSVIEQVVKLFG